MGLRNPMRCPRCFRLLGASRHGIIPFHVYPLGSRTKCSGIGCYGQEDR
jgi:hypothetical protein